MPVAYDRSRARGQGKRVPSVYRPISRLLQNVDPPDHTRLRRILQTAFTSDRVNEMRGHIEAGYVFDREVIFADSSMTPTFKPDDTFMLRGGVDF